MKKKKYFKNLEDLDKEFADQKPVIKSLEAVLIEYNNNLLMCTAWDNGEGYELSFTDNVGNNKYFSIHIDEIEMLMRALKKLKYF